MSVSVASERARPHQVSPWLQIFVLDRRSLVVFRIGIGLLIAYDTLSGFVYLPGIEGAAASTPAPIRALLLPLGLMLALGIRTRIVTLLCWLIYAHGVRAGLVEVGGSVPFERYVITLALFWGMLLPLDGQLSNSESAGPRAPFLSVASAGLVLQVALIYLSAGITKYPQEWLVERTALLDILNHPAHGTHLGQALTQYPGLLSILSVATVALEILGPLLLLIPGRRMGARRTTLIGLFTLFHVGLALTLSLGIFPWVMIVIWSALLPPSFWTALGVGSGDHEEVCIDRHPVRSGVAASALVIVIASNVVTWLYYPASGGIPGMIQELARQIALYQQWTMFSVPSTL